MPDDALAYLIRPAPRAPGAQSAPSASALPPDPPCPGDLGDGDVERAPQPTGVLSLRVRDLLGHEWVYEGPRGVDAFPDHVYRRMRVEKLVLQRRNSSSKVAINEVVLPQIAVGAARLVPGDESTIRFQAPKGVLRATSPPARPDDFADDTSFTVSLGELAKVGGNPRVAFVSETPRRSQGSRATVWFGRALTNLVGWITLDRPQDQMAHSFADWSAGDRWWRALPVDDVEHTDDIRDIARPRRWRSAGDGLHIALHMPRYRAFEGRRRPPAGPRAASLMEAVDVCRRWGRRATDSRSAAPLSAHRPGTADIEPASLTRAAAHHGRRRC